VEAITMLSRFRLWTRGALLPLAHALLPSSCALCGAACDAVVCAPCHARFFGQVRARCRQCANPLGGHDATTVCARCLTRPPSFEASVAATDYAAPVDQLVLQLKFGARLALAPWFARMLRDAVLEQPDFVLPSLLCPVPLGPQRLAERGFNQALEIAKPLATALGIGLFPRLAARTHDTRAQSALRPGERRPNIAHAFTVMPEALALVRGRHIGIVDDVMTSGQTLGELAATFKRFGAARVSNLVFARTPPR
jgi:ComF family protein